MDWIWKNIRHLFVLQWEGCDDTKRAPVNDVLGLTVSFDSHQQTSPIEGGITQTFFFRKKYQFNSVRFHGFVLMDEGTGTGFCSSHISTNCYEKSEFFNVNDGNVMFLAYSCSGWQLLAIPSGRRGAESLAAGQLSACRCWQLAAAARS